MDTSDLYNVETTRKETHGLSAPCPNKLCTKLRLLKTSNVENKHVA